jgi:hypothetical protein
MRQLTTILVLTLAAWKPILGQTVRSEIDKIANEIAQNNWLISQYVENEQWGRYITLREKATNDELIMLTDHSNGVVRCYSFQALATRKGVDVFSVLIKHLHDSTKIKISEPCLVSRKYVGDYFYEIVTLKYGDIGIYKLTAAERYKIDSILLFDKNIRLSAKLRALKGLEPMENYYGRIREMVLDEKDNDALIALAKYQKQQDKEFIIERLTSNNTDIQCYGLEAVKYFPDSLFFSYLCNIHSIEIKKSTSFNYALIRNLYQAIVQYKNNPSKELLQLTLNTTIDYTLECHSELIWLALEFYPNTIYNSIQSGLKLSENKRSELQKIWIDSTD